MAKKYYAVRSGRETGIFQSWDKCKSLVTGFKGAQFKGFETLAEAQAYMENGKNSEQPNREGAAVAYVDGSYNVKTKQFSYGAVIFHNGEKIMKSEAYTDPEAAVMRNVAGEIKGATEAMLYCVENGIDKLDLYYDYAGIEHWCTGEWKTNKSGTIEYKAYYDYVKTKLDVRFVKVKGHSGDVNNDLADKLAKQALGIE